MLGLIVVATSFVLYLATTNFGTETYIPILQEYIVIPPWIYIPCAVFIILACTNSLNLTDGLDGLAAGVTTIIMMFFVIVSLRFRKQRYGSFFSNSTWKYDRIFIF